MEFKAKMYEVNKDIFSVGTWNGTAYTEKDLESLEKNFNERTDIKVPLKIDLFKNVKTEEDRHGGMPAVGWVTEVKKVGKKLFARITDIPLRVKELIENKAYRQVSIEMRRIVIQKDVMNILTGIALLGVEQPGVSNLDEFGKFYDFKEQEELQDLEKVYFAYDEQTLKKGEEMELETKVKELEAKNAELVKQLEENKKLVIDLEADKAAKEKELNDLKEKDAGFKAEARTAEIKKFIADKIAEGKLLPKHEAMVSEIMLNVGEEVKVKFKEGDTEEDISIVKMFEKVIDSMPNLVKFEEMSQAGKNQDDFTEFKYDDSKAGTESSQKLDFATQKIKTEKNCSYEVALKEASNKYPDLSEVK